MAANTMNELTEAMAAPAGPIRGTSQNTLTITVTSPAKLISGNGRMSLPSSIPVPSMKKIPWLTGMRPVIAINPAAGQ